MPADLQFWNPTFLADAKGKLQWRHENTLNTPITSSTWLGNGAEIADVYELIALSATSVSVDALIGGSKNPYRNMTGITVVADGTTVNKLVVPGVGLIFSASLAIGWKGRVAVWNYLETDGTYVAFFSPGIVDSGTSSTGVKIAVKNVGDAASGVTTLYQLPHARLSGTGYESFVTLIAPHTSPTYHEAAVAGAYAITFADWKTTGAHKSADVYVDAVLAIQDALFDGATVYQYGAGNGYDDAANKLPGLQLILALTTADPSTLALTLTVAVGFDRAVVAPDVSGSPGTYADQDLVLTQSGESSGVIQVAGAAYFWWKLTLPGSDLAGAIRVLRPTLRGRTI